MEYSSHSAPLRFLGSLPHYSQFAAKDTDGLHGLDGLLEGDGADAPALAVLVLQNVGPDHHPSHAEHLLQLLPAHLVVQLENRASLEMQERFP